MWKNHHSRWALFVVIGCFCLGCAKDEEISEYRVPKGETYTGPAIAQKKEAPRMAPPPISTGPNRILGAVIPSSDGRFWFFKILGSPDVLAKHEADIFKFIRSVRFPKSDEPIWDVPPTWKVGRGNQFSTAAFVVDEATNVELTISKTGGDLIANLNRWRGQVGMPAITEANLLQAVKEEQIDGKKFYLVDFNGSKK